MDIFNFFFSVIIWKESLHTWFFCVSQIVLYDSEVPLEKNDIIINICYITHMKEIKFLGISAK